MRDKCMYYKTMEYYWIVVYVYIQFKSSLMICFHSSFFNSSLIFSHASDFRDSNTSVSQSICRSTTLVQIEMSPWICIQIFKGWILMTLVNLCPPLGSHFSSIYMLSIIFKYLQDGLAHNWVHTFMILRQWIIRSKFQHVQYFGLRPNTCKTDDILISLCCSLCSAFTSKC